MTHAISLTDGTTTINLQSDPISVLPDALLRSPTMTLADIDRNPSALRYANVDHELPLLINDSSAADVQAAVGSIQRLLEAARRRQSTRKGPRIYLQVELDSDTETWRTEILGGALETESALDQLRRPAVEGVLTLTCAAGWSGEEAELAISAASQAAATGGRTLTNAPGSNWLQVADTAVLGVLPAPVRLQLTNTSGGNRPYRNFYVGSNAFADPAGLTYDYEGEGRVGGYGTQTADANASGGYHIEVSATTAQSIAAMWSVPTATMVAGGRRFRMMMRCSGYTASHAIHMQPMIYDSTGVVKLWEGQEIQIGDGSNDPELIDLGTIPLPPGEYDPLSSPCRLALGMRARTAGTIDIDYLQIFGTDSDRYMKQTGLTLSNGAGVVFDEIEQRFYYDNGATHSPLYVPFRRGLWVYPGQINRFHVLYDELLDAPVTSTMSARLFYRPRRVTI